MLHNKEFDAIDNILSCVASLEATYEILDNIHLEGRANLTDSEVSFTKLAINQAGSLINCSNLVPSVESDNYFETTSVIASMEGVGDAIKQGAKAAWDFLKKIFAKFKLWFKNKFISISNKFKLIRAKFTNWAGDLEVDFPYSGFKKTDATSLISGIDSINNLAVAMTNVDLTKHMDSSARGRLSSISDGGLKAGTHVHYNFGDFGKLEKIGYGLSEKGHFISKIDNQQEGTFTIVLTKAARPIFEEFVNNGRKNLDIMATKINATGNIIEAMEKQSQQSESIKSLIGDLKGYITSLRLVVALFGYVTFAISAALVRNETGALSERNKLRAHEKPKNEAEEKYGLSSAGGDAKVAGSNLRSLPAPG